MWEDLSGSTMTAARLVLERIGAPLKPNATSIPLELTTAPTGAFPLENWTRKKENSPQRTNPLPKRSRGLSSAAKRSTIVWT